VVIILETDDIVLAEIAAGLDLDQFQQDLARVLQAMYGADGDIYGLVLVHGVDIVVEGEARRTTIQCSARW
jgi:hypothetical protein